MYSKLTNALHLMNIVFQSFYSLALPIGIGALASHLLTKHASVGGWIWAVLLTVGVFIGLYSMVKYLLSATANLQRLEKQREADRAATVEKEQRRAKLIADISKMESEGDNEGTK